MEGVGRQGCEIFVLSSNPASFSVKVHTINILGFDDHTVYHNDSTLP